MLKNCLAQQNVSVNRLHSVAGINSTINPLVFLFSFSLWLLIKTDYILSSLMKFKIYRSKKNILIWIYVSVKKMLRRQFFKLRYLQYKITPAQYFKSLGLGINLNTLIHTTYIHFSISYGQHIIPFLSAHALLFCVC